MDFQLEAKYVQQIWETHPRQATHILKKENKELFDYINALPGKNFSEKSWIWLNTKIGNKTVSNCYCGRTNKYLDFRRGYSLYCSVKCMANSPDIQLNKKNTLVEKYNKTHFSKTDDYKNKFKKTMLDRYGVENPGQIDDLKKQRARKKQLTFFNTVLSNIDGEYTPMFDFQEYTHLRDKNLNWKCNQCDTLFVSNLLDKLPICFKCHPKQYFRGKSELESEIVNEIKKIYNGSILENVRSVISPKELDIYFPKENFAIEINGIYWHSEDKVGKLYHQEKYFKCEQNNISLLMITDYEWRTKKSLILNMIKHRLRIQSRKINARKCYVETISSSLAKEFLNNTHMGGFSSGTVHFGLYHNDELCSVCTVSKRNRFNKQEDVIEIVRLAYTDAVIAGAFGKFLKKIKKVFPYKKIASYVDLRYGAGKVYENNGFELKHITKPGYWYYINDKLEHRLSWTKKKLVKNGHCPTMTESQIMLSLNAVKIYDCGHKYMILENN